MGDKPGERCEEEVANVAKCCGKATKARTVTYVLEMQATVVQRGEQYVLECNFS